MDELHMGFASLQLSDFPSAKIKVEQYFADWLASEREDIIENLVHNVHHSRRQDMEHQHHPPHNHIDNSFMAGGPPRSPNKKSPKKRTQSEMQSNTVGNNKPSIYTFDKSTPTHPSNPLELRSSSDEQIASSRRRSNFDTIPKFFVKGRTDRRIDEDQLVNRLPEIEAFFQPFPGGVPVEKFVHVTKKLIGIPSFFNLPLCRRVMELYGMGDAPLPKPLHKSTVKRQTQGVIVTLKAFLQYWRVEVEPFTRIERFFRIIKQHSAPYIMKDDFAPFIQELLHFHPGLDFLENHEEFQRKYALTVVTRIFYKVNTSRSGRISLREVKRSNLFNEFMHVDEETDINLIREYFSYEHFYVLYCRFFELDQDKDAKLMPEDLMRYNDRALSPEIVNRIFNVGPRAFSDGLEGGFMQTGMTYPDFVIFMLAEEDRSTVASLKYWFACGDLDGDGRLTPEEMWHFYRTQLQRVTALGQEAILFQDVVCQMIDFICPVNPQAITIDDLIRPDKRHISGVLFDVLFNLQKFLRFESRDPFQEKQKREDMFHCDWDRFAYFEYHRLAAEEENGNYENGNNENTDTSLVGGTMDVDYDSAAKGSDMWDNDNDEYVGFDVDDFDDDKERGSHAYSSVQLQQQQHQQPSYSNYQQAKGFDARQTQQQHQQQQHGGSRQGRR